VKGIFGSIGAHRNEDRRHRQSHEGERPRHTRV
jgi:hypothetical protein